jgi:hypothetical protein
MHVLSTLTPRTRLDGDVQCGPAAHKLTNLVFNRGKVSVTVIRCASRRRVLHACLVDDSGLLIARVQLISTPEIEALARHSSIRDTTGHVCVVERETLSISTLFVTNKLQLTPKSHTSITTYSN